MAISSYPENAERPHEHWPKVAGYVAVYEEPALLNPCILWKLETQSR